LNRLPKMNKHLIATILVAMSLFFVCPLAPWQSVAAVASPEKKETQSMPAVAPSFGGSASRRQEDAAENGSEAAGNEKAERIGRSSMTLKVKSPTLQGNAIRSSTAGSVNNTPILEGNVGHEHAGDDVFSRAGIAHTDALSQKPKPVRVDQDVYRAWLSHAHPQFSLKVAAIDPIEVLEIKGTWDKADRTLKNLGIPHTTIGSGQLNNIGLARTKVLVVNCAGTLDRSSLQGVRDFVMRGGYLLTTDWALDNMLRQTFPGYVEWNRGKSKGNVVDAHVVLPDREFFQSTVTNASWKLDEESQTIRILKPDAVKVLAISHDLAPLDPDHLGILAVTFSFGKGKVLHLVGHFDNNSLPLLPRHLPDPAPIIGIGLRQALAANFVVAGLERGH